jgi:putative ABC transport system permease protein
MVKNFLLTALRNFKRHKLYSGINIFGLSVRLTVFILAVTFFSFHLSFDTSNEGSERIYVVIAESNPTKDVYQKDAYTHLPLANLLQQNFPEIENATVYRVYSREIFRYKETVLYENHVFFTEPNFFQVFNYPITKGDKETPLAKPHSIVLTETAANKYFGEENPIGKMLETGFSETPLLVTYAVKDCPFNSSRRFDILESKLAAFMEDFIPVQKEAKVRLSLFPLEDIHLKSMGIGSGRQKSGYSRGRSLYLP